jgi:hypothetical protein
LADYTDYAAIDDKHGAGSAGSHAAIEGGACNTYAPFGGLANGVLFGMNRTYAVGGDASVFVEHFFELVPYLVAVGKARRGAHITCDQYLIIFCNNAA